MSQIVESLGAVPGATFASLRDKPVGTAITGQTAPPRNKGLISSLFKGNPWFS